MDEYLLLNVVIISFPLAATFYPKIGYYRRIPAVLAAILVVGSVFVAWDIIATARGHWAFNPAYVLGVGVMGLPLEELMFFLTVPYSCLFVYASVCAYVREFNVRFSRRFYVLAGGSLLLLAAASYGREYSSVVFLACGLFLLAAASRMREMFSSGRYWLYVAITLFLFVVFNFILTSLPIVTYGPSMIWGIRILTIPMEDFFYNYLMLSLYLSVFLAAKKKFLSEEVQ